jgi:hypothetical protein
MQRRSERSSHANANRNSHAHIVLHCASEADAILTPVPPSSVHAIRLALRDRLLVKWGFFANYRLEPGLSRVLRFHRVQSRQSENRWRLDRPYCGGDCWQYSLSGGCCDSMCCSARRHARDNEISRYTGARVLSVIGIYRQLWTSNLMASGFKLLGGIEWPHGRNQFRIRADADIEMTRRKAFPAILRLRDRSYRKPIE